MSRRAYRQSRRGPSRDRYAASGRRSGGRGHFGGSGRRRGRPLAWLVAVAVLAAAAVLAGRAFRLPSHGRGPVPSVVRSDVQVFFVRGAAGRAQTLAAARRRVAPGSTRRRTEAALRALLHGPSRGERAHGLISEIPPDTVLRRLTVADGVATVDLSIAFAQGGGSTSMLGRVWQVVYTATQFPDVSAVQLLVGGRRVAALGGEGVLVGGPLRRPASMPTF